MSTVALAVCAGAIWGGVDGDVASGAPSTLSLTTKGPAMPVPSLRKASVYSTDWPATMSGGPLAATMMTGTAPAAMTLSLPASVTPDRTTTNKSRDVDKVGRYAM